MLSQGSASATLLIAIGLAGIWGHGAHLLTPQVSTSRHEMVPAIAALAWAQTNCDATLTLRQGTPRIQAEDLFRAAAAFDADRDYRGLKHACSQALAVADSVAGKPQNPAAATSIFSVFASLR